VLATFHDTPPNSTTSGITGTTYVQTTAQRNGRIAGVTRNTMIGVRSVTSVALERESTSARDRLLGASAQ
jgi:hypothetical protein